MATNAYHLVTHWRVPPTVEEVFERLLEAEEYPRWWPGVFRAVRRLQTGHNRLVGQAVEVQTRGFLPYTLRFRAELTEVFPPHRLAFEVAGDFVGRGIWSLEAVGDEVHVVFDWRIRVTKPLVRWLSWLCKPLFVANHRWSMEQGEQRLAQEIARRAERQRWAWLYDYEERLAAGDLCLDEVL
jgi:uncharacterized protein YndB with AHSA1/START domain